MTPTQPSAPGGTRGAQVEQTFITKAQGRTCWACWATAVTGTVLDIRAHGCVCDCCGEHPPVDPRSDAPQLRHALEQDPRLTRVERVGLLANYWSGDRARVDRAVYVAARLLVFPARRGVAA